jgi:hypothetical protein
MAKIVICAIVSSKRTNDIDAKNAVAGSPATMEVFF